ncbi:UNVERIFIED_CONTAM: Subtilisin-like protease SBT4.3 [Sesamum radiatum]|uniref:Subtilisin-like protease SBT4.3 n=1 Tax=Sesamum radiatum TaxID=300843 RepID=A0AAW2S0V8_SESRA
MLAEYGIPFSKHIVMEELPAHFRALSHLPAYNDNTNPAENICKFENHSHVLQNGPINDSARDREGHGTHTAFTAAGNYVKDASFCGIAKGTARVGVPSARIAAYKVCHRIGCLEADILAAFDDAIADGVDILSISLGPDTPLQFQYDSVAIGLSCSTKGRFSVAIRREQRIEENSCKQCVPICLEPSLVKGKILLCDNYLGMNTAFRVGAVGSVTSLETFPPQLLVNISFIVPLPASHLSDQDFNDLQSYYAATITPKVDILTSESVKNIDAPLVADFSSRGPNGIVPDILKPDVTAPGTEILAAFSPLAPPSDKRSVNYSILSGTSMSCPHVAGAAAYVKSFHPDWSPSATKSALMTTAWRMDPTKDSLAEFSYGTGHIDPVKAVDPGLVYETFTEDYINLLCSLGYNTATLRSQVPLDGQTYYD